MPKLELTVTELIDMQQARDLVAELDDHLEIGGPHLYVRRAEPSDVVQYIQIIGKAAGWLVLLDAARVFLRSYGEIIGKRAGELTGDKLFGRKEIKPLADVATALTDAKTASSSRVEIVIGVDIPDRHFGTALHITSNKEEEVAHGLAVFVTHADEVSALMKDEVEAGRAPLGRAIITLEKEGGLTVRWQSRENFATHERKLP